MKIVNGTDYEVPVKDDGDLYLYELVTFGATQRIYSDSTDELLSFLIPGMDSGIDSRAQLEALLKHAFMVQTHLQAHINAAMPEQVKALSPEQRSFLENARSSKHALYSWSAAVPLVLVDASFAPFTSATPPTPDSQQDNIIWITPARGAKEYLLSLDEAGYIALASLKGGGV